MSETESWPWSGHKDQAIEAECFETPEQVIDLILQRELLTNFVLDPCCGRGVMARKARDHGKIVRASDRYDWGYGIVGENFLADDWATEIDDISMATVFINPPFSLATDFVIKSLRHLKVRKVICYQRFAWYESKGRRDFWTAFPPNRVYITEGRWDCWRIDIPPEQRKSSRPYQHAWFVWERGQPSGTLMGRLEA